MDKREVACHRTVTNDAPWQWMQGPPSVGTLNNLQVHPTWRIEYAYSEATVAALEARVRELEAREEVLQRALDRWLPSIAGADDLSPMHKAASEDASLLYGGWVGEGVCFGDDLIARAEQAEAALSVAQKDAEVAIGGLKAWAPILMEIDRRAEKEGCLEERCDFTVTILYDDYVAVDAAFGSE